MKDVFLFAVTNLGSEKALKSEVAHLGLPWRSGYQRKGFVTFTADTGSEDPLAYLFKNKIYPATARRVCLSLGKFMSYKEALAACQKEGVVVFGACGVQRDLPLSIPQRDPRFGEVVGVIVQTVHGEFWAGIYRHRSDFHCDPCGLLRGELPLEAPSRAWLKLEDGIKAFSLSFSTQKDRVVEVGCSPGGVLYALLQRGIPVVGIDPAEVSSVVEAFNENSSSPLFTHIKKPASLVGKREIEGVTWFLSDMNQSPEVVLREALRFAAMAPTLKNILITLKLRDLSQICDRQRWEKTLVEGGFSRVRLQQLSVHNREYALLAQR